MAEQEEVSPLVLPEDLLEEGELRMQIISDAHLELFRDETVDFLFEKRPPILEPVAPICALLGDVGKPHREIFQAFLAYCNSHFRVTLVICGNHEYYNDYFECEHTMQDVEEKMVEVVDKLENVYYVERRRVQIGSFRLLPTILWSHCPSDYTQVMSAQGLNDYYVIFQKKEGDSIVAENTNEWFAGNKAWLETEIADAATNNCRVGVLTHHTPLMTGTSDPKFGKAPPQGENWMNHGFSTDLRSMLKPPVEVWAAGHTHYNFDIMHENVRVVSNQVGYPQDLSPGYDPRKVIVFPRDPPVTAASPSPEPNGDILV